MTIHEAVREHGGFSVDGKNGAVWITMDQQGAHRVGACRCDEIECSADHVEAKQGHCPCGDVDLVTLADEAASEAGYVRQMGQGGDYYIREEVV